MGFVRFMEFVMLLSMLLFAGICTIYLVLGISDAYSKKGGKKPVRVTTRRTQHHN